MQFLPILTNTMNKRLFAAVAASACCACSAPRKIAENSSRSFSTTTHIVSHPETIEIRLPVYCLDRSTADSVSELVSPVASSTARINADGTLSHTLRTSDSALAVAVASTTVSVDSVTTAGTSSQTAPAAPALSGWLVAAVLAAIVILTGACRKIR